MKKIYATGSKQDKELPVLIFLWRWKVVTTAAVFIRFRPVYNWAPFTAYSRLLKLQAKGLVEAKLVNSRRFAIWTLTRKGFLSIIDELPLLKEEGFASEAPEHDLYVLAAQFGDWLPKGTVDDVAFFTEQELRRQSAETLFSWLPPTAAHRPDGYWYFPNTKPNSLVSLEVEINRKSFADYVGYGNFYNRYKVIESVVWIVQSQSLAKKIVEAAHGNLSEFRDIHNFILLKDFLEMGWSAPIFHGFAMRSTMSAFLNHQRSKQAGSISAASTQRAYVSHILDQRLCRFDSATCVPPPPSPPR